MITSSTKCEETRFLPLAALTGSFVLAAALVMAVPAPAEEAGKNDLSKWVKVCETEGGTQACTVMQRIIGPDGELLSSVSIRQTAGAGAVDWVISMPLGFRIPDGVVAKIDDLKPIPLKFNICSEDACFIQVTSNETLINAMRAGGTLRLTVAGLGGSYTLPVTLKGFTRAYDGKGVDVEAAAAHFEKLDETAIQELAAVQAELNKVLNETPSAAQ